MVKKWYNIRITIGAVIRMLRDRVKVVMGDITTMKVDAIINAANNSLLGGGGVDGAIHAAAGPGLLKECETLGGCETGRAKVTGAYNLPCKMVIHTAGPIWQGGETGEETFLRESYQSTFDLAVQKGAKTIAYPAISTGVYRFPIDLAASVACQTVADRLRSDEAAVVEKVFFVCFNETVYDAYMSNCHRFENGEN